MFHNIPKAITERMQVLEEIDARDRQSGAGRLERLRQIPAETGKFLALLAAVAPPGKIIEIGTSAGYSTMWLSLACRMTGTKITTFEVLEKKVALANETFQSAGIGDIVTLVHGDARQHLSDCREVAFCFLDAEKDVYQSCFDLVVPNMVSGGLLIADNAESHYQDLKPFLDKALSDKRLDSTILPVGKGELLCRKK